MEDQGRADAIARAVLRGLARQRRHRRGRLGRRLPLVDGATLELSALPEPPPDAGGGPDTVPEREGIELILSAGLGPPLRFGLNQTRCYTFDIDASDPLEHDVDRYGRAFGTSLSDCVALGVDVVRQVGDAELTWPALTAGDGMTTAELSVGAEIPTLSRLRPGGSIDPSVVVPDETITRLRDLLAEASDQRVKLIFTLLHYGNGGLLLDRVYPPEDEGVVPGSTDLPAGARESLSRRHVNLRWSADHVGMRIPDDELYVVDGREYDFPGQAPGEDRDPIHTDILDPWSPYMHIMVRHLAELAGLALLQAHAALAADNEALPPLSALVDGIELFNEVDHDCTTIAGEPLLSGQAWGRTCYHAARGLRIAIPDAEIKLMLPGLSSWQGTLDAPLTGQSWEDRKGFVQGLVQGFAEEYFSRAEAMDEAPSLASLQDKIQGIDLHWYHYRETDPPLHAGFLGHEVAELRQAIAAGLLEFAVGEDADAFAQIPISVFETSTATLDPTSGGATKVPTAAPFGSMTRATWQAHECWRRLLAALCGDVQVAGWHSWMSGTAGSFVGTGLREDGPAVGSTVAGPGDPKPAWHSYQAVAWLMRHAASGRLVHPLTSSREALQALVAAASRATDRIIVFELRLDHAGVRPSLVGATVFRYRNARYVYVVMLDPTVQTVGGVDVDDAVEATSDTGSASVYRVDSTGVDGDSFVGDDPSTWVAEAPDLSVSLRELVSDPTPRVYLSSHQLTWSAPVDRLKLGRTPTWVIHRSAWWDGEPWRL